MGCGSSKGNASVAAFDPIIDFFNKLVEAGYPDGVKRGYLPGRMEAVEEFCLETMIPPLYDDAARVKLVAYFNRLINKTIVPVNYSLFNIATEIIQKTGKFLELDEPNLNFFEALAIENEDAFNNSMSSLALCTNNTEAAKLVVYFNRIINRTSTPADYHLFNIANKIIKKSGKIWELNENTLRFFDGLATKNEAAFNTLMSSLGELCTTNNLFLTGGHIDTVIASLDKHTTFPPDAMVILDEYLTGTNPDIGAIVTGLRQEHRPEIARTASTRALVHHDIPHAVEIRMRTMHVIRSVFNLWNTGSKQDRFLSGVASIIIELHDLVQKDKGTYASVEVATAARVVAMLTEKLHIETNPKMIKIIELMADQIIVGGTTMVYSKTSTSDLSYIFAMVRDAATVAEYITLPMEGPIADFCNTLEVVEHTTSVCDKTPVAFHAIGALQHADTLVDSLPLVKRHSSSHHGATSSAAPTLLEQFFSSGTFIHFFSGEDAAQNQQRFLISLVPHLSMRAEICSSDKSPPVVEAATKYMDFIRECRTYRKTHPDGFNSWYAEKFSERGMTNVIETVFINNISEEIKFSRSQVNSLRVVRDRLVELLPLVGRRELVGPLTSTPIIDPEVPAKDATNLETLRLFYMGLEPADKVQLCSELFLVAALQAGEIYQAAEQSFYRRRTEGPAVRATPFLVAGGERVVTDALDMGDVTGGTGEAAGGVGLRVGFFKPPSGVSILLAGAASRSGDCDDEGIIHPPGFVNLST
jgi:hypothetical protein